MSPEKEAVLRRRYPLVYGAPFINDEPFRCDDGWVGILDELGAGLTHLILKEPEAFRAVHRALQVKEKFGGLRVYIHTETPEMGQLIAEAERKAWHTCEICGEPGATQTVGLVKTLCGRHFRQLHQTRQRGEP